MKSMTNEPITTVLTHMSLNHQSTMKLKRQTWDPEFKRSQLSGKLGVLGEGVSELGNAVRIV